MGQITIRFKDEDEKKLKIEAEKNNLILAGQYLQKAFSLASEIQSKKPYRITDIQTQYARFLLLRAIEEKVQDFDGAYNDFLEAKKILTHVINNEPNKREAYRPAKSLEGFVFTFKKDLKVNHLNEIYSLCVFILDKISKAKYSFYEGNNKYINQGTKISCFLTYSP